MKITIPLFVVFLSACTPPSAVERSSQEDYGTLYVRRGPNYAHKINPKIKSEYGRIPVIVGGEKRSPEHMFIGPARPLPDDLRVRMMGVSKYRSAGHWWYYALLKTEDRRVAPSIVFELPLGLEYRFKERGKGELPGYSRIE